MYGAAHGGCLARNRYIERTCRMSAAHCPRQNHLLAALSAGDFERVSSGLKLVPLPLGEVLYESGSRQRAVYFPTTAIVSLLYMLANGASAEIAVVGNEGLIR